MDRLWGPVLAVVVWLGSGGAHAQEADVWVTAADAEEESGPATEVDPPRPVVTLRSGPSGRSPDSTPPPSDRPADRTSLGIRIAGAPAGLRVHLRPVDAAWGEPYTCIIPCTALVGPGDWAVTLGRMTDVTPLPVDGSPLSLLASGRLDVRYADRRTARAAGVVLLVIGALALVGALIGVGVVYGQRDDGSLGSSIDRFLGAFLAIPGVAGIALGVTGIVLTSMGPTARARWTPDP